MRQSRQLSQNSVVEQRPLSSQRNAESFGVLFIFIFQKIETVVFDSLNRVFDNLSQNNVNIESISHFQNEVKKHFADWLQNLQIADNA